MSESFERCQAEHDHPAHTWLKRNKQFGYLPAWCPGKGTRDNWNNPKKGS